LHYLSFLFQGSHAAQEMIGQSSDFDKIIVFQYSPVTMALPAIKYKKLIKKTTGKDIPLFIYCFDLWPESIVSAGLKNKGILYELVKLLSKWLFAKADGIFISSQNFEKYFNRKLNIYNNIKYLPIYAESLFTNSQKIDNPLIAENEHENAINLVFAGNVGEMQSVETIIMAMAEIEKKTMVGNTIPNIKLHIVGDGSSLAKVMKLAQDLSLKDDIVIFHGRFPIEDMPKFYDMADAFLVTLKADPIISYTLPGKVQSYMAYGKPIIAAINGETADVIQASRCGVAINSEDSLGLANAIIEFAKTDKKIRQEYGESGKAYYDANFSVDSFMSRFLSFLSD